MRRSLVSILAFVTAALLAPSSVAQQRPEAEYDQSIRTWSLWNELIEVQFRLNSANQLRIQTLGRRNGKRWVSNGRPAVSPVYLRVGDVMLNSNTAWELITTRVENVPRGGRRHLIRLRNAEAKAEITLRLELYAGQPFLRTWYSFHNLHDQALFVDEARFFHLRLNPEQSPVGAFFVDQMRQGTPLNFDLHELELSRQKDGLVSVYAGAHADQSTWLALRDVADNGLAFGWEFNGRSVVNAQWRSGDRVDVWGLPLDMHTSVGAGRELTLPAAFVGLFEGDWDEAGYRTQRFVESALALPRPDDNFPYLMFNTWGYGQDINEASLRRAAQIAAQVGVEVFVVDLGWAQQIGEWEEDSRKFPGGLRALADYIRGLGMKFGLHFVPVEAAPQASVLAANPDWTASVDNEYFGADSVCISNGPTQAWLREATMAVIERYQPDWITQDAENLVKECTKTSHTHDPGNSNWANSVTGLDSFIRYVRFRAPKTLWENNADGGTMSTFEAVKNYSTFASCDACEHMPRRQAVYGMSYVFSPRFINRYMSEPPIKFTTRSSMFGGPWILMQPITSWTQAEIQLMREEAAIYKSLRGLIREGKVFHLLGRPTGYAIEAIESYHPDWDRGVIFVYRPDTAVSSQTILPRGLKPDRQYRVTFQESRDTLVETGAALMSRGISVRLPTKNFAEIIYLNPL